jgi:hypothetical protein
MTETIAPWIALSGGSHSANIPLFFSSRFSISFSSPLSPNLSVEGAVLDRFG